MAAPSLPKVAAATLFALCSDIGAPSAAGACVIGVEDFDMTGDPASDATAPEPPRLVDVEVRRGRGARPLDGGAVVMSCDDIGWMRLRLEPLPEGSAPEEEVGFLFVIDGAPPAGFRLPDHSVAARDGVLSLHWIDGDTDEQEPFAFELTVIAVDRAGNRSEPSEPLRVSHPGRTAHEVAAIEVGCWAVRQSAVVAIPAGEAAELAWYTCRDTAMRDR